MLKPIKPGSRCLIIKDARNTRHNVGALLTATEFVPVGAKGRQSWMFKDASRDLVIAMIDGVPVLKGRDSGPYFAPGDPQPIMVAWPAAWLMPLDDDFQPEETEEDRIVGIPIVESVW